MRLAFAIVLLSVAVPFAGLPADAPPRILLNLTDGSRIIGTTELSAVPLRSASIGEVKIPLLRVSYLKFSTDHQSATITLVNGDKLEGTLGLSTITVATVFGAARVPLGHVRDFQVGAEAGGHAVKLSFDAKSYIEVPASDDFDITESWTLEFWASITGGRGENLSPIIRLGDDCGHEAAIQMDILQLERDRGNIQFWGTDANGDGQGARGKMNIMDGQWHHWAGVVGNKQMRLYIDGVRVASHAYKAGATGSNCPLRIGYRATHGGCFVDGTFDEIRISHIARYDNDFMPATSYVLDGDTIAYWRFNEGTGDTVHDETGKHNGTLRGSRLPTWVEGVVQPNR